MVIEAFYLPYHVGPVSPRAYPIETAKMIIQDYTGFRSDGRFCLLNPIGKDLIRLRSYECNSSLRPYPVDPKMAQNNNSFD